MFPSEMSGWRFRVLNGLLSESFVLVAFCLSNDMPAVSLVMNAGRGCVPHKGENALAADSEDADMNAIGPDLGRQVRAPYFIPFWKLEVPLL
jgi:hypothetical protein